MSDDRKYYYLKLKDNFFESDDLILLETMPDGYVYSNILLKLYLKSLKDKGKLTYKDTIPYNPTMLATLTRHQIGTIEKALSIFQQLGLIEILDNGTIYMLDIQNYIGTSGTEADRKRLYRKKIQLDQENGTNVRDINGTLSGTSSPDIEIDIRDKDIHTYINPNLKKLPEKEKKYIEEVFQLWQQVAKDLNTRFTNSEWDALYGYMEAKPNMSQSKIRNLLLTVYKWADEDGLDIITALNTSHAYPFPKQPFQRIVHGKNNQRIYGNELKNLRRKEIEREELEGISNNE